MSQLLKRYGDWGLIVGSAKGIGASFSEQLAMNGFNLILVDNKEEDLVAIGNSIKEKYAIEVHLLFLDLKHPDSYLKMLEKSKEFNCRLMIYNAAFSTVKKFSNHTSEELDLFLQINVSNQLKLVHGFVKQLKGNEQKGGILLMSSLAGLLGVQFVSTYAATKAFAWNLAESLHHELKSDGITISACLAGATLSETYINTKPTYGFLKPQLQTPEVVARYALRKMGTKPIFISGVFNRMNYFILLRLLPRKIAARIANKAIAQMYRYVNE